VNEADPTRREGLWFGAALLALGALIAVQTFDVPAASTHTLVGAGAAPLLTAALLALLGAGFAADALRGGSSESTAPGKVNRAALVWVGAGLLLNLALIAQVGFILATTVLFAATARGFGSGRPWRDAATGFVLATLVWLAFDRGLGYRIGTGLVENLL
jgi:putative tricarboxylic transport membrane protein